MVWRDPGQEGRAFITNCQDCKETIRFIQTDELPYGWEKVEDPHYGTYFIDHVNRKTQYENPVVQAKRLAKEKEKKENHDSNVSRLDDSMQKVEINGRKSPPAYESSQRRFFTRNPEELKGEIIKTLLTKSPRGFGFTIVGGDDTDAEEFLQIKNVVPQGPAFADGKLRTGDVLVFVDEICVLGFTHQDVVTMFQGIPVGEQVCMTVCRGYSLPFDPNDPNTEIITTVAVTLPDKPSITTNTPSVSSSHLPSRTRHDNGMPVTQTSRSAKSMPDLSAADKAHTQRNKSFDEVQNDSGDHLPILNNNSSKPELMTVNIVKGSMGFGFTIADSAYGQKVKQILDKARCQTLQEGDILVEINDTRVKDMPHADVVNVLKECPRGVVAAVNIQRGGMLLPSRKKSNSKSLLRASSEDGRHTPRNMDAHNHSPRIPYDMDNGSGLYGMSESPSTVRSKTPTQDYDGSDPRHRAKTPTKDHKVNDLRGSGRFAPGGDMGTRHMPGGSVGGEYNVRTGFQDTYGGEYPRDTDYHGYGGPRDYRGGHYDRSDVSRTELGEPRREYRSRTPGPDFMRGTNAEDAYMRSRTHEMRSKTPTHEMQYAQHHNISGTPDFIPASRYNVQPHSPSNQNNGPYDSPPPHDPAGHRLNNLSGDRRQRPLSGPDFTYPYGNSGSAYPANRINTSQTFSGNLNYAGGHPNPPRPYDPLYPTNTYQSSPPDDKIRPRKQSTSFENEEPVPSNLTRLHRGDSYLGGSPQNSLNRSRSPTRFSDDDRYMEMTVYLRRHESGFGFRIVGGTEEGSQVSVGHIVAGGAADLDSRLQKDDEILYVDGASVIGSSHHKVVQLMSQASIRGGVTLGIRRRIGGTADSPYRSSSHDRHESYPYDVTVTRRENEGFGFVIISSVTRAGSTIGELIEDLNSSSSSWLPADWVTSLKRPHPWIGRIIENSPAERCGRLHVGDRILSVNNVDIMRMHHEEIVQLIKDSGYSVTLTIGPPTDDASSTASSTQRSSQGSMINAMAYPAHSESDISRQSGYSPYHQAAPVVPRIGPPVADRYQAQVLERHKELVRQRAAMPGLTSSAPSSDTEEDKYYAVELHRGSRGFGFSIRGGREFGNMPLFILRIADGGAADLDGRLRVGDQIIEINSYNTNNMTHAEAIDLIQNGGSTVRLLIKRTGKPPPNIGTYSSYDVRYSRDRDVYV